MKALTPILFLFLSVWAFGQRVSMSLMPAHTQAQVLPEYPGGMQAMKEYIESTDYPDEALDKEEQGVVVLSFTVTETGEVGAIKLLQTSGYHVLDSMAMHEVNDLLDFTPGFKYGAAVPVLMTIAVKYSLTNDVLDGKHW